MWTREQKDLLNIIYGDDLVLVGDVVVARNEEKDRCKIINMQGELLVDEDVLGITRLLGRGGFHYLLITDKKEVFEKTRRNTFVSSAANSRYYSNYIAQGSWAGLAGKKAEYTEYTYKIFSSEFDYEHIGKARTNQSIFGSKLTVEVAGKLHVLRLRDCMLEPVDSTETLPF